MINKPLKSKLRSHYYTHVHGLNSKPGEKIIISRKKLMTFIVLSFNEINNEQIYDKTISESFNKCGVNPYSLDSDLEIFRRHLDSINEVKAYELLIEANHHEELKASLEYNSN